MQKKILSRLVVRKLPLSILCTAVSLKDEILRLTNKTLNNLEAVREGTTILRRGVGRCC